MHLLIFLLLIIPKPIPICSPGQAVTWDYAWRDWKCIPPSFIWRSARPDGKCYAFSDGFSNPAKETPCPK